MTRFGMDVVLAHPEGYDVMPEGRGDCKRRTQRASGGSFTKTNSMEESVLKDADIVYPKSWAPFAAMERNVPTFTERATSTVSTNWKKELLAQNAQHKDWACTEETDEDYKGRKGSVSPLPACRYHRRKL